jgi:hypothetical protein
MTMEHEIYAPFIKHAEVRPSGETFLTGDDEQQFATICQRVGMAVLGIEGARIDSNQVEPYIDAIADYSPKALIEREVYRERCNRLARDFLKSVIDEKGAGTYFCFEVLDSEEYLDCMRKITP